MIGADGHPDDASSGKCQLLCVLELLRAGLDSPIHGTGIAMVSCTGARIWSGRGVERR